MYLSWFRILHETMSVTSHQDRSKFIGLGTSRRSSGSFELKLIDGTRLKESVNYKKLRLLQRRTGGFITEFRTEGGGASSPELPLGYPRRY